MVDEADQAVGYGGGQEGVNEVKYFLCSGLRIVNYCFGDYVGVCA